MKTATLVKDKSRISASGADQRLYKVDPPLVGENYDYESEKDVEVSYEYVIVSAVYAMFGGPETYIFGANAEGDILDWGELEGSFRGGLDHKRALQGAGYVIVTPEEVTE